MLEWNHVVAGRRFLAEKRSQVFSLCMQKTLVGVVICAVGLSCIGCGSTKSYIATDQLLMSDAVDATVAKLDFSPLSGHNVYLDATYIKTAKSPLLVDSDYVISSLRQQMVASGVMLTDTRDDAEIIAEARLGALGLDGHNVSYGIPASSTISTATGIFANAPAVPTIPEISLARHEAKSGAAKIAVFAYEKSTKKPVWQSGIARSKSSAHDTWVLGAGPWQRGTIYEGTQFAGEKLLKGLADNEKDPTRFRLTDDYAEYVAPKTFEEEPEPKSDAVVTASAEEVVEDKDSTDKKQADPDKEAESN